MAQQLMVLAGLGLAALLYGSRKKDKNRFDLSSMTFNLAMKTVAEELARARMGTTLTFVLPPEGAVGYLMNLIRTSVLDLIQNNGYMYNYDASTGEVRVHKGRSN